MGIKSRADQVKNLSLVGKELDIEFVCIVADLSDDASMVQVASGAVWSQLIYVVQPGVSPITVVPDLAAATGINADELYKYKLRLSCRRDAMGDMTDTDKVEFVLMDTGSERMQIHHVNVAVNSLPAELFFGAVDYPPVNLLRLTADCMQITAGDEGRYYVLVEVLLLPNAVPAKNILV